MALDSRRSALLQDVPKEVIIAGGGVAGISAAVAALEKGWKPLLLERTAQLGGRVSSLYAKDAQKRIDAGQHVLSAAYTETCRLLQKIGSLDKIEFQKRLFVDFRLHFRRNFRFHAWPLPAPLHFLFPLLLSSPLGKTERRFLFRWFRLSRHFSPGRLKAMTVREWLDAAGKAPFLEKLLWEPLSLATLNTPIEQASGFLLRQALEKAFLGTSRRSGLGIPKALLGDIFAAPAEAYIRKNGGEILTTSAVKRVVIENGRAAAVETRKGETFSAPLLILALPPHALTRLIKDSPGLESAFGQDFSQFRYSPIVTAYLWLENPLPGEFPMALVDSPAQWIFRLPDASGKGESFGYAVVISGAFELAERSGGEILELINREFRHFFAKDIYRDLRLLAGKVVKEKFATILQTPQAQKLRPACRTGIPNLFLAGDWIDTGLPATIESAAVSGRMAVEEAGGRGSGQEQ